VEFGPVELNSGSTPIAIRTPNLALGKFGCNLKDVIWGNQQPHRAADVQLLLLNRGLEPRSR